MAIHLLKYTGLGLVLVARAAWAAPQYTLTDLGTLGGNYSQANGVNSLGRAVGTAMDSGGHSKAFIYQGGGDTDLGSLGGIYSSAFAVNGSDQAVGQSTIAGEQQTHACLFSGGSCTDFLGAFGGINSSANAINASGQIAGSFTAGSFPHAFRFSAGNSKDLGTLGGQRSVANDINGSGNVVGWAQVLGGGTHSFMYTSGPMTDLGTMGGVASVANGINDLDQIVGTAEGISYRAFLYDHGVRTDLGNLGGPNAWAYDINNSGTVVGASLYGASDAAHAFVYQAGVMYDLNSVIPPGSGWTLKEAHSISDAGHIVGYAVNEVGASRGFLLTPVPEPSTSLAVWVSMVSAARLPRSRAPKRVR